MANDKISLNALIEEAEAAKLSLNAYLLPQSAAELEITEEELLSKMAHRRILLRRWSQRWQTPW